jgi:hypothetical protein
MTENTIQASPNQALVNATWHNVDEAVPVPRPAP